MSRTPLLGQWQSEKFSQGYIADYKPFTLVDGEGVRCSLYVSGCLFACEGCFNEATWSFRFGRPYDDALGNRIVADLAHESVQGLTLLGGEPFLNTDVCLRLVRRVRREFGHDKDIWSWSGYRYEELIAEGGDKLELLEEIDVLVDGKFEFAEKDLMLQFRGSRNQRVLDVPASLSAGAARLWPRLADPRRGFEQVERRALL